MGIFPEQTAYTIKWAVIGGIFVLFFIFLLAGYVHAQKRMKKGLRPLAYHRVCSPCLRAFWRLWDMGGLMWHGSGWYPGDRGCSLIHRIRIAIWHTR